MDTDNSTLQNNLAKFQKIPVEILIGIALNWGQIDICALLNLFI